ncbi:MAG: CPBP family intramembrane metalloprotease [Clostridia bacterium]|nr:CPBP family intramembrane metalloprotease [Clostridia bacterium]
MAKERKRYRSDNFILAAIFAAAIIFFSEVPVLFVFRFILDDQGETMPVAYTLWSYADFIFIWIIVLACMLIFRWERPLLKNLAWNHGGNGTKKFFQGLAIGFIMNGICVLAALLHGDIYIYFDDFRPLVYLAVFVAVYIQSGAEELVMRFFLYRKLERGYKNIWVAILVNSVLFAAIHLGNPGVGWLPILDIFVTGIAFSLLILVTDNFWIAASVHCAWNFTQNMIFGLPNSGLVMPISIFKLDATTVHDSLFYNTGFGVEGTPLGFTVNLALAVILFVMARKQGRI